MKMTNRQWANIVKSSTYAFLFNKQYNESLGDKSEEELENDFKALLEQPIDNFNVYDFYYYVMWYKAIKAVTKAETLNIMEVASGSVDIIPKVMDKTLNSSSSYVSANMNKELTKGLYDNTKDLSISIRVIEDDSKNILDYVGENYFDMILFHHGANDVIQAILCEKEGIDTINTDWMKVLPDMIKIMQREYEDNTLEEHAKEGFLGLLSSCIETLKDDGYIIFNHHMFKLDLDWGYPYEIWSNIIPIIRRWINESSLPVIEIEYEDFNPNWWMFLKKCK